MSLSLIDSNLFRALYSPFLDYKIRPLPRAESQGNDDSANPPFPGAPPRRLEIEPYAKQNIAWGVSRRSLAEPSVL